MKKLLIVGPSIERGGIGGVTVHCQRLRDWLDKEKFPYEFADYKALGFWGTIRCIAKSKWIHINVSNPPAILLFVIAAKLTGGKTIVTFHGYFGNAKGITRKLKELIVAWANKVLVLNEKSFNEIKNLTNTAEIISAFIPPTSNDILEEEIKKIVRQKRLSYNQICLTNATSIAYDKDGKEIYGIDFLIDFFENQKDKCLIISDPSGQYGQKYVDKILKNVLFISRPHSFFELAKLVDLTIRNTSTDGDALSVKESLFIGKTTLCSDVVERPQGVVIFKYCEKESLYKALNEKKNHHSYRLSNGAEEINRIYKRLNH